MIVKGKHVYHGVIDIPKGRSGGVAIQHDFKPAGEAIPLASLRTAIHAGHHPKSLTFPFVTRWHRLVERRYGTWMTDAPIEQFQHDRALQGYRGRVLVGGLGLGYAVTALAVKPHVREIVVVERSKHIVNLVWPHIKANKKATIVVADLFDFLATLTERFDRAFFDIWQGDGEATFHDTIVPLRVVARSAGLRRVECWNEDVMRGQLMMGMQSRLMMIEHAIGDPDLLDKLTADVASIFIQWARPFWLWYRRRRPSHGDAMAMVQHYVQWYGIDPDLPAWMDRL